MTASHQNANTTYEQQQANQNILRHMANDLIEQYFLPTVNFFGFNDLRMNFVLGSI